jgi:hypothetical protein
MARIGDFSSMTLQLENAHSVYNAFVKHIEAVKEIDLNHNEIRTEPVAFYLRILGHAGEYNKLFEVFNSLDESGRFSAGEFIYSKMFTAIAERKTLSPGDKEVVSYRNASDAKLLWKKMMTVYERDPSVLTTQVTTGFLKAVSRGRPSDHLFAYDIIRDNLGLAKPGEIAPPPRIELNGLCLDLIISLCLFTQKYRLCIHYYRQVIARPPIPGKRSIIDFGNMEKILLANAQMTLAGSFSESSQAVELIEWMHEQVAAGESREVMQPRLNTYTWALMACWRGGDWASTTRIVELMSGCHAEDFTDQNKGKCPTLDARSKGLNIKPDNRAMSCVVRAALASGDLHNMRQCLRMLSFFRESAGESLVEDYLGESAIRHADRLKHLKTEYYDIKFLSTLKELLGEVLADPDMDNLSSEEKTWRALLQETKRIIRHSPKPKQVTPLVEQEPLGSASRLAATAAFVEYEMAARTTKSSSTRK